MSSIAGFVLSDLDLSNVELLHDVGLEGLDVVQGLGVAVDGYHLFEGVLEGESVSLSGDATQFYDGLHTGHCCLYGYVYQILSARIKKNRNICKAYLFSISNCSNFQFKNYFVMLLPVIGFIFMLYTKIIVFINRLDVKRYQMYLDIEVGVLIGTDL